MGVFNVVQKQEQRCFFLLVQLVQELVKVSVRERSDRQDQALVVSALDQGVQFGLRHALNDQALLFGIAVDFSGKVFLNPFRQEDLVDLLRFLRFQKVDSGMPAKDKIFIT